jgi:hypothetical protein
MMDTGNSMYQWGWHNKYVGRWVIEIPLSPQEYGVFGHGCLLDIIASALEATSDFFFPTQIEYLAENAVFDQPVPLTPDTIRETLDQLWSTLARDEDYEPGCDIQGVSNIYVRDPDGVTRALVPQAMGLRLECDLGKKPVAMLTVYTKCDAWLECTLDGYDNAIVGSANGPMLTDNLIALETRLGGTITDLQTDFDEVNIEKYSLKNK